MTTETTRAVHRRLSPTVLVGGAFAMTTLLSIAFHVGEIVFTDHDPQAPAGPIESIQSVALVGTAALAVALAIAVPLARHPVRAKTGAIVLGALTLLSLPVFWSGAPAAFGATAAWLGGLARGSHPQTGAARGFGIVGLVVVVLITVATVFGGAAGQLID